MLSPGLETKTMAEKLLAFSRDFLLAPKVVSGGVNIAIFLILPLAWHYLIHKKKNLGNLQHTTHGRYMLNSWITRVMLYMRLVTRLQV